MFSAGLILFSAGLMFSAGLLTLLSGLLTLLPDGLLTLVSLRPFTGTPLRPQLLGAGQLRLLRLWLGSLQAGLLLLVVVHLLHARAGEVPFQLFALRSPPLDVPFGSPLAGRTGVFAVHHLPPDGLQPRQRFQPRLQRATLPLDRGLQVVAGERHRDVGALLLLLGVQDAVPAPTVGRQPGRSRLLVVGGQVRAGDVAAGLDVGSHQGLVFVAALALAAAVRGFFRPAAAVGPVFV